MQVTTTYFPVPDESNYTLIEQSVEMIDNNRHYVTKYKYHDDKDGKHKVKKITRIYELHKMPRDMVMQIQQQYGNFNKNTTWEEAQQKINTIKKIKSREKWAKFGDALNIIENNGCSMVAEHDTYFELTNQELRNKYSNYCSKYCPNTLSNNLQDNESQSITSTPIIGRITCKHCQGPHWSHGCTMRNKDTEKTDDIRNLHVQNIKDNEQKTNVSDKNSYVPPHLRGKKTYERFQTDYKNKEKTIVRTIKLNNLSKDMTQDEVKSFCEKFGRIYKCIYKSNSNGGYAYITYTKQDIAELVINQLNGQKLDNAIISAEWAKH